MQEYNCLPRFKNIAHKLKRLTTESSGPPPNEAGPTSPVGPLPPGLPGGISSSTNPYFYRLAALKKCLQYICTYLGNSANSVPKDAIFLLRELFLCVSNVEAASQKDAAEIKALSEATSCQATTIASLPTKVEKLVLASRAQPSIKIAALQNDLDSLRQ